MYLDVQVQAILLPSAHFAEQHIFVLVFRVLVGLTGSGNPASQGTFCRTRHLCACFSCACGFDMCSLTTALKLHICVKTFLNTYFVGFAGSGNPAGSGLVF